MRLVLGGKRTDQLRQGRSQSCHCLDRYNLQTSVMHLMSSVVCSLVVLSSLLSCKPAYHGRDIGSRLTRQPIQIVHYGHDGPLASIEGEPGLYYVVFDPDCQGCEVAEKTIQPASLLDTSLCEFGMIVSGVVEMTNRESIRTLRIKRVNKQPNRRAGHQQGNREQPCERQHLKVALKETSV